MKIGAVPKVREAIKLIEADGWREVTTKGQSSPVQAPDEDWTCHDCGAAV